MHIVPRKSPYVPFYLVPRWVPYATGILTMAMVSAMAGAQSQTGPVQVTPNVITVDHATHTAKVRFINTTGDTTSAKVTLQSTAPGAADAAKPDSLAQLWSLSAWVTNVPAKLTLTPHETLTVTLNLAVPASAKAGEYATYLVVHTQGQAVSTLMGITSFMGMQVMRADDNGSKAPDNTTGGNSAETTAATKLVYRLEQGQKP